MDIAIAATDLLDLAATTLGERAPTRQYITIGAIASDCSQLAVSLDRIYVGSPSTEQTVDLREAQAPQASAELTLVHVRCASSVEAIPTAAEIEAVGELLIQDGEAVFRAVRRAVLERELFPSCDSVSVGPLEALDAEGGMIGFQLRVTVGL